METGAAGERIVGGALAIAGLLFAWYAAEHYTLGTLRRMGPGMFPMGLGLVLAGLGVAIMIAAPERNLLRPDFSPGIALKVISAIVAFGLIVSAFGLVPAIMATVVIASLAEPPFRPLSVLLLGIFLCVLSWLIFKLGLGLPIYMMNWPF